MESFSLILAIVVVTALAFDFTNGFHDTANAMATTISTGALKPKTAVAMSAVLNLVGAFLSVEVAKTISGGIINENGLRTEVIFAALVGAILWNLLTWLVGLPSSSSHALFGGLIGAIMWNLVTWYVGLPSSSSHALFGGLIGATWVSAGADAVHTVAPVLTPNAPPTLRLSHRLIVCAKCGRTPDADGAGGGGGFIPLSPLRLLARMLIPSFSLSRPASLLRPRPSTVTVAVPPRAPASTALTLCARAQSIADITARR